MPSINEPKEVTIEAGKTYFWCTCGLTQTQPFCDGSHKGSGKKSLPFQLPVTTTVWLCQCKRTGTPPYCDGSHSARS